MAQRLAMLKYSSNHTWFSHGLRWAHSVPQPPPLSAAISGFTASPPPMVPEIFRESRIGLDFPNFSFFGGAMELMAVPKRKTSPHKRGIRNGPKALKPVPVIVRCKACGRVKLQHFFCCSGIREHTEEHNK